MIFEAKLFKYEAVYKVVKGLYEDYNVISTDKRM